MKSEQSKSLRMVVGAAITACVAVAPLTPAAAAISPEDSSLFAHQSEMNNGDDLDANESTTNWTLGGGAGTASLAHGLLSIDTTPTPTANRWWASTAWSSATSDATGWTIEVKVQIVGTDADDKALNRALHIYAGDGADTINLEIGTDHTYYGAHPDPVLIDSNSNTGDFHVFRIAKEGGSKVFHVWRDGVLLGEAIPSNGADHTMYFGDGTGSFCGKGVFDYVRWDETGAFSPEAPKPLKP